jgi:WD40 repeat protein
MKRTLFLVILFLFLQSCGGKTGPAPIPTAASPEAVCGNGTCESAEGAVACPEDCATSAALPPATATPPPPATLPATFTPTITPTPGPFDLSANPYAGLPSEGRIGQLGRGAVQDIHFNAEGNLAVLSASGIWTYDGRSLQTISTPSGEKPFGLESTIPLAWSPDGKYQAGARDQQVILWVISTGTDKRYNTSTDFSYHDVSTLAWSSDGRSLAAGAENGDIFIFLVDAGLGDPLILNAKYRINALAWTQDGRTLASASGGDAIILWDVTTGAQIQTLKSEQGSLKQMIFSPDGRYLAGGFYSFSSKALVIWDAATGEQVGLLEDAFYNMDMAFSPDNRHLAVGSRYDLVVWDITTGSQSATFKGEGVFIKRTLWSPDGGSLVSLQENGTLTIWDAADGQQTGLTMGHLAAVDRLAWSPQGSPLASAVRDTGVLLWDTSTWQLLGTLWADQIGYLQDIAWSPDGRILAGGFGSRMVSAGTIRLVDPVTGAETSMSGHEYWVSCLAWSPDGKTLASGSNDTTLILWDPATQQQIRTLKGHTGWVYDVAFSPDGSTLASAARSILNGTRLEVILWDVATGRQLRSMGRKASNFETEATLVWSADGGTLTAYMDGDTALFDAATGQELPASRDLPTYSAQKAFSPDNLFVAYGTDDGMIILDDNPYLPKTPTPSLTPTPSPTRDPKITPSATPTVGLGSVLYSTGDGRPMVFVPAGPFLMGASADDPDADPDEKPQHELSLEAFWIDQYEVTHADYAACVQAGSCTVPSALDTNGFPYDFAAEIHDAPVINVSWDQASAYCAWAGKTLPTEAQWEKAARGTDARIYPWGKDADAFGKAWFCSNCIYDPDYPDVRDDFSRPAAVGSFPEGVSPYGAFDMAGNVWEWVLDWYAANTYSIPGMEGHDGPQSGEIRVVRGGSWTNYSTALRTTYREARNPLSTWIDIGFRCVMQHDLSKLTGGK